jgi:hypothetical protein
MNPAEEFGLSFAKLITAVVRNVHTTDDRLQLESHTSFQGETKQFSVLCREFARLDSGHCLEIVMLQNSNARGAKLFDALGHYVGQESNRSFGGLMCFCC